MVSWMFYAICMGRTPLRWKPNPKPWSNKFWRKQKNEGRLQKKIYPLIESNLFDNFGRIFWPFAYSCTPGLMSLHLNRQIFFEISFKFFFANLVNKLCWIGVLKVCQPPSTFFSSLQDFVFPLSYGCFIIFFLHLFTFFY